MQSTVLRRARKADLSAALDTPAELPFFEVDPSAPTTSVTVTVMCVRICTFSPIYQVNTPFKIENAHNGALALKHEKECQRCHCARRRGNSSLDFHITHGNRRADFGAGAGSSKSP